MSDSYKWDSSSLRSSISKKQMLQRVHLAMLFLSENLI